MIFLIFFSNSIKSVNSCTTQYIEHILYVIYTNMNYFNFFFISSFFSCSSFTIHMSINESSQFAILDLLDNTLQLLHGHVKFNIVLVSGTCNFSDKLIKDHLPASNVNVSIVFYLLKNFSLSLELSLIMYQYQQPTHLNVFTLGHTATEMCSKISNMAHTSQIYELSGTCWGLIRTHLGSLKSYSPQAVNTGKIWFQMITIWLTWTYKGLQLPLMGLRRQTRLKRTHTG